MDSDFKKIVEAYRKGEISIGKLALELGMDPVSARDFLRSHGIQIHSVEIQELPSDTTNA